jgi:UDP:flavonoid glycosyltransferase YjiC (YdhE family)
VRILFAPIPAVAHLYSLAPLAWAFQNAGHDVAVACEPYLAEEFSSTGLVTHPVGVDVDLSPGQGPAMEFGGALLQELALDDPDGRLTAGIFQQIAMGIASYYLSPSGVETTEQLSGLVERFAPDLVVWDAGFHPAAVAAARHGVPHARYLWGRDWTGMVRRRTRERGAGDVLADAVTPVLRPMGLEFDESLLVGEWTIDPNPASLRFDTGLEHLPLRWTPYTGPGVAPSWLLEPRSRPRVCVSFGVSYRIYNGDEDLPVEEVLRSVASLDVDVVATLDSRQLDPATALPDNVRLVDFVPLGALLPTCSAVVHHGGTGTWSAALEHGTPQVVVARDSLDYPEFARLTDDRKAGISVPPTEDRAATADAVRAAVLRVVEDPAYADGTRALRAELHAQPAPAEVVAVLERELARRGRC